MSFDLFSREKINHYFNKIEELNEILPYEKLSFVYNIYSFDNGQVDLFCEELVPFNEEQSVEGVVFSFEKYCLYIMWNCDTDEVDINFTTKLLYPTKQIFQINKNNFFMIDVSQTKIWKKYLNKACDWIWILINSSACVDSIQLSFDNMHKNIQILALNELKFFELKRVFITPNFHEKK